MKRAVLAPLLGAFVALAISTEAWASNPFLVTPTPIVRPDVYGNRVVIHPSATLPGAGVPMFGTKRPWTEYVPGVGPVTGWQWRGMDGRVHGQISVPIFNGYRWSVNTIVR